MPSLRACPIVYLEVHRKIGTSMSRHNTGLPSVPDRTLCCIICGAQIAGSHVGRGRREQEVRKKWTRGRRERFITVPSAELEQTDFRTLPHLWTIFYPTN
jgi:hypothetical protein